MIKNATTLKNLHLCIIIFLLCIKDFMVLTIEGFSNSIFNTVFAIAIVLTIFLKFIKKYRVISLCRLMIFGGFFSLMVFSSIKMQSFAGIIVFLLFFIIDKEELDDAIKYMLYTELFLMALLIPLTIFKYVNGYPIYIDGGSNDMFNKRYRFAFSHPNVIGGYLFNITIMWTWVNFEKLRQWQVISIGLLNTLLFFIVGSKTVFLDSVIFLILILYVYKRESISKTLKWISAFVFPIMMILTYYLTRGYVSGNLLSIYFNNLLSNRIHIGAYSLSVYGLTMWGQYVELGLKDHSDVNLLIDSLTFDNLYSYLMINVGIIYAIIISIAVFFIG